MKMEFKFSNFDVFTITKELDQSLSGATIVNVYEVEDLLLIKLSSIENKKLNLIIKNDTRINLTNFKYPIPKYPSQFIISLRKFLKNRRIKTVSQHEFDRIIIIELYSQEKVKKFIIELFNKGNYLFLDENDVIKIGKSYRKFRNRDVLPNKVYEFPKKRGLGFLTIKKQEFLDFIANSKEEIVRDLARNLGISGIYSEEICLRANIEKSTISECLNAEEKDLLFSAVKKIRNQLLFGEIKANIVFDNQGNQISVFPFELTRFNEFEKKYYKTFNSAVDNFYSKLDIESLKKPEDQALLDKIEAQKRILESQIQHIDDLLKKKDKYYSYGDFIYANFNSFEKLFRVITDAKKKGFSLYEINDKLIEAKKKNLDGTELFERIIPSKKEVIIKIGEDRLNLKLNKSVGENANEIYSKGKKAEQKIVGTDEAIKKTRLKIKKLEKSKDSIQEKAPILIKKRKKHWYEKFRWFVSSNSFLIIGGRDASSNESIFRKYIESDDLVFHTNYPGSPLAIVKNPQGEEIPELTIKEAADFVASYSSAWKEEWGYIDVFYVNAEQVSKTPPSGEYLPKGSFMILGNKRIVKDAKTELAIGLELIKSNGGEEENKQISYNYKILCGPLGAIKSKTDFYLIIKPSKSGYSKGKLAKRIKTKMIEHYKDPIKKWIKLLSEDELILYLPPGKSIIEN